MTGTTQQNTKTPQVHIPAASAAGNASVSVTLDPQAQLESDKRAVYRSVQSPMRASCVYWSVWGEQWNHETKCCLAAGNPFTC